jgi:hypothetical protein
VIDDDVLDSMATVAPEVADSWRAMRDRMARAFGERAPGQEHRAWIEHGTLRDLDPESRDWRGSLEYLGLADLPVDDAAMPVALRRLLQPKPPMSLRALIPGSAARHEKREGRPAPWTLRGAVFEALDALEAQPFVVEIGGVLVENVPTHSRLKSWRRELAEGRSAAERRRDKAESLVKQIRKAAKKLGETSRDGAAEAAERTRAAQHRQVKRINTLDRKLELRLHQLDARLEEVRSRARLEHLRDEARALAGAPQDDTPEVIAAELELDLGELVGEVMELRRDLDEEAARYRALSEIASVER